MHRPHSEAAADWLGLDRRTAVSYLALFLVCAVAYPVLWPEAPFTGVDTPRYLEAARDWSDLRMDQLQYRTPGYPLLLLATRSAGEPGRLLFHVSLWLHFAAVWLVGTVLHALQFGRRAMLAAAAALCLPPFVENAAYILTENLTQFMLVAGFAALFHWFRGRGSAYLVTSSLAFAYAGLTRPTYQAVAVVVAVVATACGAGGRRGRRELARAATILVLASGLLIGGYAGLNYIRFGYFGVTPMLGFHLATKTVRVIERLPERDAAVKTILLKHRDAHLTHPNSSHTGYMYIWSAVPELEKATGMSTAELSRYMQRLNLRLIAAAPLEYVMEVFRATNSYWFPAITAVGSMGSRALQLVWSVLHFALLGVFLLQGILVAGTVALFTARRHFRGYSPLLQPSGFSRSELVAYAVAATVISYTMLVSVLVESGVSRVRTPADVFLIVMILIGYRMWWRQVTREDWAAAPAMLPVERKEAAVR